LRCGSAGFVINFALIGRRHQEIAVATQRIAFTALVVATCALTCAAIGRTQDFAASRVLRAAKHPPPLLLVQNSSTLLPQMPEAPVSPINPGTLPGSTAAIGGSATGTNPITGLPCNGSGSLSVSGAGGLPGTATPPPQDSTETLDQIPVGTPPFNSVFGSQTNLGSC
jgi:hypothetical protein